MPHRNCHDGHEDARVDGVALADHYLGGPQGFEVARFKTSETSGASSKMYRSVIGGQGRRLQG